MFCIILVFSITENVQQYDQIQFMQGVHFEFAFSCIFITGDELICKNVQNVKS